MRTTLTLDADVAAQLERVRKARNLGLKEAVNEAMRRGLVAMSAPETPRERFRTKTASLGECRLPSLDNVEEALSVAEGEDRK
ncbi:MAG TPA: hypothetical protein VMK42_04260 [Anaeromyxobacteraceae bacterium]|nr:hypothetical protein [Anaeromyxobacteraceae bacterium]